MKFLKYIYCILFHNIDDNWICTYSETFRTEWECKKCKTKHSI